jgi:hypothetical protein
MLCGAWFLLSEEKEGSLSICQQEGGQCAVHAVVLVQRNTIHEIADQLDLGMSNFTEESHPMERKKANDKRIFTI